MKVRAPFYLVLIPLLLFSGCERSGTRRARQVMSLVHTMGVELRTAAAQATATFTDRGDFEELRKGFGDNPFDVGIPLGPEFQVTLDAMLRDLDKQLEKEPKDDEFLRKSARQIRLFSQWWTFIRHQLEVRRSQLAQPPGGEEGPSLRGGRGRREGVLMVLSETIKVVSTFEVITTRCVHRIEDLITRS